MRTRFVAIFSVSGKVGRFGSVGSVDSIWRADRTPNRATDRLGCSECLRLGWSLASVQFQADSTEPTEPNRPNRVPRQNRIELTTKCWIELGRCEMVCCRPDSATVSRPLCVVAHLALVALLSWLRSRKTLNVSWRTRGFLNGVVSGTVWFLEDDVKWFEGLKENMEALSNCYELKVEDVSLEGVRHLDLYIQRGHSDRSKLVISPFMKDPGLSRRLSALSAHARSIHIAWPKGMVQRIEVLAPDEGLRNACKEELLRRLQNDGCAVPNSEGSGLGKRASSLPGQSAHTFRNLCLLVGFHPWWQRIINRAVRRVNVDSAICSSERTCTRESCLEEYVSLQPGTISALTRKWLDDVYWCMVLSSSLCPHHDVMSTHLFCSS